MNINNQQNMSQQSNFNFLGNSSPVQPPTISLNEPVVLNLESNRNLTSLKGLEKCFQLQEA